MFESRRWSILLYAVFLSAFLLVFFASFRTSLSGALSDSASRDLAMRSASVLSDVVFRMSDDFASVVLPVPWYVFQSPNDDGSLHTWTVFGGIPQTFSIRSKSTSSNFFEAYCANGDGVEFVVYDSLGNPFAHAAVSSGSIANVALPPTATGTVVVTSLWSRSVFEIDRKWSRFEYPDSFVRAYRTSGRAKEYLWIFSVSTP